MSTAVIGRRIEVTADLDRVTVACEGRVVDPRPAGVGGRGVVEQVFLDRVLVQSGDGGQPAGDGRAGSSSGFEVAGEQLDVGAADGEQAQLSLAAR
jgi:hypothetical protein